MVSCWQRTRGGASGFRAGEVPGRQAERGGCRVGRLWSKLTCGCRHCAEMQWLMGSKCEGCSRVHHTVPGKQNWLSATSQCSQCYTASVSHRVLRAVGAKRYPQLWKAAPQHISPHMHDAVTHGMPEAWCLGAPVLSGSAPSPSFLLPTPALTSSTSVVAASHTSLQLTVCSVTNCN